MTELFGRMKRRTIVSESLQVMLAVILGALDLQGGEPMHPSEREKGKRWATWKKGTYRPKVRNPYDFSKD
jgi:hypothetical protein